jgi:hypothetical protein
VTDRDTHRVDLVATLLLSFAALATSWAGYQATRWSGVQSQHAGAATAARARSSRASTAAGQLLTLDVGLFNHWMDETSHGDWALARFIQRRFRPEFRVAFDAWLLRDPMRDPGAAPSPFSLPQYHLESVDSAEHYEVVADSESARSTNANNASDAYVLAAVILATVMFFASAAQNEMRLRLRWSLITIAAIACIAGVARLVTLPRA